MRLIYTVIILDADAEPNEWIFEVFIHCLLALVYDTIKSSLDWICKQTL